MRRRRRAGRRRARCRRPRWRGSRRGRSGAGAPAATLTRARRTARRRCSGVRDVQAPGASTGPTPCQTRMPAASRRSSSAGASGCCARVAFAPSACRRRTIASMSPGSSASPRPGASSCSDAPRSRSGRPLRRRRPPPQRSSRRPDARGVGGLAPDREAQVVEVRDARAPTGPGGGRRRARGRWRARRGPRVTGAKRSGVVAQRAASRVSARAARRLVTRTVTSTWAAPSGRRRVTHGRDVELAGPQRAQVHRAVDAAEVEPRAVPGVGLHRGRVAVVGADDERGGCRPTGARAPRRAGRSPVWRATRRPSIQTVARWLTDSKATA